MAMAYSSCDQQSSLPSAASSSSSSSTTSLIAHSLHHKWAQTMHSKNGGMGRAGGAAGVRNSNAGSMMSVRAVQAPPSKTSRFDVSVYEEALKKKKKKVEEEVKVEKLKELHDDQLPAEWSVSSWRSTMELQQELEEEEVVALAEYPPLVFAGEAAQLEERLAEAAAGRAFVLQAEDCSGHDQLRAHNIRDTFRVLLQMAAVLMFGGQMPVIKMGSLAGQFAPSPATPHGLPAGHLIDAYSRSAATLNLLRSFANGGYAAMQRITQWNLDFTSHSDQGYRYLELARRVDDALGFMSALGLTAEHPVMRSTDFWTSHECLLLPYEQALTRLDSTTGRFYDCSAHMLWVGQHTRQPDDVAHIEFLRGVANPIAIKANDRMDPTELVRICEILNPENKAGRLTVIVSMGADNLRQKLPHLIRAVRQAGMIVTWVSDPMHGNSIIDPASGLKTRPFQAILDEVEAFFDVHEGEGSHAGGIHLEMTGQNVTECIGGSREVKAEELHHRYLTNCEPRLNASQSLELAFIIASRLRKHKAGQQQPSFPV